MSRGYYRDIPDVIGAGNMPHFRELALKHCYGLLANIARAEQHRPGSTGDALLHAKACMAALQQSGNAFLEVKSE